jgi:fucose 4-O-acetylase-like acetyltransferase
LIVAGTALLALYYCAGSLKDAGYGPMRFWDSSPDLVLLRLGSVLLLIIPVVLLSARVRDVPATLLAIGRRTLPIYLLHLVILYGSPWNQGLNRLCYRSLPPWPSIFAATLMLIAMIGFAVAYGKAGRDKFHAKMSVPQSADRLQ